MNAKLITRLSVFAVAGAMLAGCASDKATQTAVGATGGAATGAAVGGLVDGGKGAAIGAGVGALAGGIVGDMWKDIKDLFGGSSTPAGTTISQQQDGTPKVVLSGDASFAKNSAALLPGGDAALVKIVTYLKAHPDATLEARGYTDSTGGAHLNQILSQKRAQSVLDYLSMNGVPPNQLMPAQGFGDRDPIASNETVVGRASNRRVELYLHRNGSNSAPPTASE